MRRSLSVFLSVTLAAAAVVLSLALNCGPALAEEWQRIGSGGLAPDFNPVQGTVPAMSVYDSALYAGTSSQGSPSEVWRYDGSEWSMVGRPGFGNRRNTEIASMHVYKGKLYAGTFNGEGCEVWRYDGSGWGKVSSSSDIGKAGNIGASSMAAGTDGWLYVGTYNYSAGCEVWRYSGSAWQLCVGPGKPSGAGFGNALNRGAPSMAASTGGTVYVGTENLNGCEVWGGTGTSWSKVSGAGLGIVNNRAVRTLTFFNARLYAGTENNNGCQVRRYDGGTTWAQVNTNGFGSAANSRANCSTVFGSPSRLYVGVDNTGTGCQVWRYEGGISWAQVNTSGFGSATQKLVHSMAVFGGRLHAGAKGEQGSVIYSTAGGASVPHAWTLVSTPGFTTNGNESAGALAVFKGTLYAGTDSMKGCQVRRFDGVAWTQVGLDGFGNPDNYGVSSMAATASHLYVGVNNGTTGAEVWRYDGSGWTRINTDGFGDATTKDVPALVVFDSKIYAGTESYNSYGRVWRYDGGTTWTKVNTDGFGSSKNVGVESLAVFDSHLYAGTFSSNDPCTVWRYNGGTSWTQVSALGFGKASTTEVDSMVSYGGSLYASSFNRQMTGAEVWRYNGGASWSQANVNGFGDGDTCWPYQMLVSNGSLYVSTGNNVTGGQIWSNDGSAWKKACMDGMGNVDNSGIVSLASDGTRLFAGTENWWGGCEVWASEPPGNSWYLAEGSSAWGFSTYVTVQNPNPAAKSATVTYMTSGGEVSGGTVNLPADSQTTINPAGTLGQADFSTMVTGNGTSGIAVDRTMYWTGPGAPSPEAHSSVGVRSPAWEWYLPEGSTAWGFETWLVMQNPGGAEATCQVTYMIEGEGPQTFAKTVPPNSRRSFSMAEDIGAKDASIKVASSVPVIAERAMYRNGRREGHGSTGTTVPANDYYLAEGTSAWGFTTYLCIQNPSAEACDVEVTYMTPGGARPQPSRVVPGNSRTTIRVNDAMPDTDFSTRVHGSLPIIAERAMYWDAGLGEACHDSIGLPAAHRVFYLPDGQTSDGRETWTCVQNSNPVQVEVEMTYMTPTGTGNRVFTETIPANSRRTFNMAERLSNSRAAVRVECKTAGRKIMVERAMYWNSRGAGTGTIGGFSD